uniref:Uncharacterized protein n=1 Tax=Desulfobacca acetoxidans TaxID=60893 RepID=A0A7V4G7F1_9BACT
MDPIDSQENIAPLKGIHNLLSKPVADKEGQGPGPEFRRPRQPASSPAPEPGEEERRPEHLIDIKV